MSSINRNFHKRILLIIGGVIVAIVTSEIYLRWAGMMPVATKKPLPARFIEADPKIGWINKPGNYSYIPSGAHAEEVSMRIASELNRSTGELPQPKTKRIDIFGCSFTHGGEYVRDQETYSSILQGKIMNATVRNFGVIGYSTYQAFQLMQHVLPDTFRPEDIVLYGLVDFHQSRNVVTPEWLQGMANGTEIPLVIPFIHVVDGAVTIGMDHWTRLPLSQTSSLIALLENAYGKLSRGKRAGYAKQTLLYSIDSMRSLVEKKGGKFKVVYLAALNEPKEILLSALREHSIEVIDCVPSEGYKNYTLPEDLHPNPSLHKFWGECINRSMQP